MHPSKILLILAGILYLISLALPAVATYSGIACLFAGVFALLIEPAWGAVWLANMFFFAALIRNLVVPKGPKVNWLLAAFGVLLASGSFFIDHILVNEGGTKAQATLHPGYYVWLSAMLVLLAYNVFIVFQVDKSAEEVQV